MLDIGCGWGGTALYLNRVADVRVTGVTLSEEQLKVARERAQAAGVSDQVDFQLVDYRHVAGQFDRIVSIGMFEHVGAAHYGEFFATCRDLLSLTGHAAPHIGKFGRPRHPIPSPTNISPAITAVAVANVAASEKARLITTDVETLRLHYGYTLRHWLDARARRRADRRFVRRAFLPVWEFTSPRRRRLRIGTMCNYQLHMPATATRCRSPATI